MQKAWVFQGILAFVMMGGLSASAVPLPEPHEAKAKELPAARPVSTGTAEIGIQREGLPEWATMRFTALQPDDQSWAGAECTGGTLWGFRTHGQARFEGAGTVSSYPTDYDLYVFRDNKMERIDLGKIEGPLQKKGFVLTAVQYLGKKSLVAVRVTDKNDKHELSLMDAATGASFLEEEIGGALKKGEKIHPDITASMSGRFVTIDIHDADGNPQGILVVDLDKRRVKRFNDVAHSVRWVSNDGERVFGMNGNGQYVIASSKGNQPCSVESNC